MEYLLSTKLFNTIEKAKPKLPTEHYVILTQIAKGILELFNSKAVYQLTAESEYLLERYIDDDIPTALDSYINFPASDGSKQVIDNALLVQLKLIKDKVDNHETEIQNRILDDMKTQNSYLSRKQPETANSTVQSD